MQSSSSALGLEAKRSLPLPVPILFLQWYFIERPMAIVWRYLEYVHALLEMFSFVFLVRTLFAPWKSIMDVYPTKGFQLMKILETLSLNTLARAVGCTVRLGAIAAGIFFHVLLLLIFAIYLAFWIAYPVILTGALYFFIEQLA